MILCKILDHSIKVKKYFPADYVSEKENTREKVIVRSLKAIGNCKRCGKKIVKDLRIDEAWEIINKRGSDDDYR